MPTLLEHTKSQPEVINEQNEVNNNQLNQSLLNQEKNSGNAGDNVKNNIMEDEFGRNTGNVIAI